MPLYKSSIRVHRSELISVQIHNQTCNYLCAVFPEAFLRHHYQENVRLTCNNSDFRPPKKNMRMSTEHPSCNCPKSLLTWNCLGRQSRSASAFQQGALYTVYISQVFFMAISFNFELQQTRNLAKGRKKLELAVSESLQHCT